MRKVKATDVGATKKVVCDFFHQMLNDPNKNFWAGVNKFGCDIKQVLIRTFPNCMTEEELQDIDLKQRTFPFIFFTIPNSPLHKV